jgi:hypothetical protein
MEFNQKLVYEDKILAENNDLIYLIKVVYIFLYFYCRK